MTPLDDLFFDAPPPKTPWNSRTTLLAALIFLTIIASLFYSGPSIGMMSLRLLLDGGVLLLWIASAAGLGSALLPKLSQPDDPAPGTLIAVTSIALGLGVFSLLVLFLGLIGWLNGASAWAMLALGIACGIARIIRRDTPETRAALQQWLSAPAGATWLALLALPFVVVAIVGAMAPPGFLWSPNEPHGYDVIEYHLQIPREWYELGRIVPLHHNVFSYFPFNVEMHYLLAMHLRGGPWAGMYLDQLMHGAFVALSVLAVYGFVRWKAGRAMAAIAALAAFSAPLLTQLGAIAYDEGGLLLFGTLAIGWAMRAVFNPQHRLRRFALAGITAGLASGTKWTGVPTVLIPICIVSAGFAIYMTWKARTESASGLWSGIFLAALLGVVTLAPWLLRNAAWAGNPVFPEAASLLGGNGFSEAQVQRWENAHHPPPAQRSFRARINAFWNQVLANWQFGYLLLPAGVLAFALARRGREAWFLFIHLLIGTVFWIGFTHLQGRFYVLAVPLSAMLIGHVGIGVNGSHLKQYSAVLGTLVLVALVISMIRVNVELLDGSTNFRLYGQHSFIGFLGADDLSGALPGEIEQLPADTTLILVGDARAFWYPIPMSRLRYRTVFDVNGQPGENLLEAWSRWPEDRRHAWMWVDPLELKRFAKTYHPLPSLPPELLQRDTPFMIKPDQK